MIDRKERARLHQADRRLRRRLTTVASGCGAVALLVIAWGVISPPEGLGLEIYKLLLQFVLITAGGGLILTVVGNFRDESLRRQARATSIQSLDLELDRAYRDLKRTKRRLRAYAAQAKGTGPEAAAEGAPAPLFIRRGVFEQGMDDLLKAQLELETICEHIRQRDDILEDRRLARMRRPLRYASRYYHDVHEDFEKGRVWLEKPGEEDQLRPKEEQYVIPPASNVADYLRSSRQAPAGRPEAVALALNTMRRGESFEQRTFALLEIMRLSPLEAAAPEPGSSPGRVRYADVAGACFDLLSAELADARLRLLS